jgi:hypothetical protein
MNTTCLETVCRVLESKAEYPTDELLVRYVKVQQLAQTICVTLASASNIQNQQLSFLPMIMVVKSLQSQIDDFKASLSADLQDHSKFLP